MPIAFIAIGALFLIAAVRGTITDYGGQSGNGLLSLLKSDFVSTSAQGNFLVWLVTLWIIGALGYIPGFKPVANALLFLVILVLVLANSKNTGTGGIFAEFNAALTSSNSSNALSSPLVTTAGTQIPGIPALPTLSQLQAPTLVEPFSAGTGSVGVLSGSQGFLPGGTIQVPGLNGIGIIGG